MATIKSWPVGERPRERLLEKGGEGLSDAELLAVLFRSGMAGKDAIALSREILQFSGGLRGLFKLTPASLGQIKGLGPAKIVAVLAVKELAARYLKEESLGKSVVRDPQSVFDYLAVSLRVDIRVLDHLIIGDNRRFSFAEQGIL